MADSTPKAPEAQPDPRVAQLESELAALRAQMAEAQAAPAPTEDMDESPVPGGVYISGKDENGKPLYVNAEGQPIDSKGNVKKSGE